MTLTQQQARMKLNAARNRLKSTMRRGSAEMIALASAFDSVTEVMLDLNERIGTFERLKATRVVGENALSNVTDDDSANNTEEPCHDDMPQIPE